MSELFERHRDNMTKTQAWRSEKVRYLPHYHAGIEIVYVLEGTVSAMIGGRAVTAGPGEVLVSGSYAVHSYGDEKCRAIVAIFPPNEVQAIQKSLLSGRFVQPVFRDESGCILSLLEMLLANLEDDTVRLGLSYAVLGYVMRLAHFEVTDEARLGGVMAEVLSFLSKNHMHPITAEQLAAHFGYSRSRFSHLFKANIGVSIPRYINILRCRDAAKVLIETDMPVVDVAINAGFNNAHTFYVAFRELYGMTPGEYVKEARAASRAEVNKKD